MYAIVTAGVRRNDSAFIPNDPANSDWQAYEKWCAEGNVATPAAPAVARPLTATAKQLRYALNQSGQRTAWNAALATVSADTRDYWDVEPDPPVTSSKMKRIATAAGVDINALYDLAVTL